METFTRCTTRLRDGYNYSRIVITSPSTRSLMFMNSVMLRKLRSDTNPCPTDHESKVGIENSNYSEAWPLGDTVDHLNRWCSELGLFSPPSFGAPGGCSDCSASLGCRLWQKRASTLPVDSMCSPRRSSIRYAIHEQHLSRFRL